MKLQTTSARRRDGGALILTAIVVLVSGAVLATYLLLSQNEYAMVNRSQSWSKSMSLTEAGVEDALAFINKYEGDFTMVTNWSTAASAAEDSWTMSGSTYTMHRVINAAGDYYDVSIDNSNPGSPTITSAGKAAGWTMSAASTPFMLAAAGVSTPSATINRKVVVKTMYSALFPGAITTQTNIDLNGNNVRVDSFDSTLTNASIWNASLGYGTYSNTIARANGNVATDSSLVGAITVGQANIYGHVDTGPGGTATVGNNGYVGPLPQVGSGIQTGYSADDMNMVFPSVTLPTGAASWPSIPSSRVITNSGNYYMFSMNDSVTISNAANVTIYVANGINLSGGEGINIGANVSKVTLYVGGGAIDFNGQAQVNYAIQNAGVLGIYGLPSLTSVDLHGNAAFYGTVYAPQASFAFGGGGSDTQDFIGALVAYDCKLKGKAEFHYDESLKRNGPGIGYIPFSWTEVSGN